MNINKKISNKTKFILALLNCYGVGKGTTYKIYNSFFRNNDVITDEKKDIEKLAKFTKEKYKRAKVDEKILMNNLNEVEEIIDEATEKHIKITSIDDENFPERFKNIGNSGIIPPIIIYSKGDLSSFESTFNVAIIGTRKPTKHGLKITDHFSKEFSKCGCSIISGLALGCDTQAHKSCLEVHGKTLAILPGNIDKIVPSSNKKLAEDILDNNGALISEYFKVNRANKGMFVERDRLQSLFSDMIIISSANLNSGTKHAVKAAQILEKDIFTYKPSIMYENEEMFKGNLALIKDNIADPLTEYENIPLFLKE